MVRSPNSALRHVLAQAGLTYEAVARGVREVAVASGDTAISTNRSSVAYWVAGSVPQAETAGYLLEVLSRRLGRPLTRADIGLPDEPEGAGPTDIGLTVEDDPVETLECIGRADIERRRILTTAAYSVAAAALPLHDLADYAQRTHQAARGSTAGAHEVQAVRAMVAAFTAVDERYGGRHGRSTVVHYLTTDVARLLRARWHTSAQRSEMFSAAASLAYLAGWKASDAAEPGLAQRYYLQAFSLSRSADRPADMAYVLRIMAHHGMDNHAPQHTLGQAEQAVRLSERHLDAATRSLMVICHARALAHAGRHTDALREAERARTLATSTDRQEVSGWSASWGDPAATVATHTAALNAAVGNHAAAEAHYAGARAAYATSEHVRVAALLQAAEGRAQLRQGRLDQACATWHQALDQMRGIRSSRTVEQVSDMRTALIPFSRRGSRPAQELDQRARAWLHSQTTRR